MKYFLLLLLLISLAGLIIPSAFADNVPDWVKNTAGWWATDAISETEFVNAIEFLVKENIILVDASQTSETSQGVPDWVKNTAGWWATDAISETEFVNAIAYLIKVGIINIESSKSPELIAEKWVNGHIDDDEFLASVEHMIENGIITVKSDSITKMSQLPDWLVNNAGWWAARILTNSDFDFDPGYVKEEIYPCIEFTRDESCFTRTYNSYGFRGDEFQEQKHEIDFRIFAVGGSTTNGAGANDNETWPAHLQQIINEKIMGKKIEVINAGIYGATTAMEYNLIKDKLYSLDPDLIIMYDGWNDSGIESTTKETIHNWELACKLGKAEGFDTIIVVQPKPIIGQRVLTDQEITNSLKNFPYLQKSQQYVDAFEELDEVCTKTADFRRIFNYIQEPIFWDEGHTMSFGNKIIAENVFSVISPIYFGKTYSATHNLQTGNNESGVVYAVSSDLSNRNFDNLDLQNAVFDKADLSNTSFRNANIDGARFVFANLSNSNLLDRTDLSNVNLAGVDLSNINLKGKNLSGTNLSFVDLSEHDLTGTNLAGANLSYAKVSKESLKGKNLSGTNLSFVDLSEHDLTGTNLSNAYLSNTILTGVDLSGKNLSGAILSFVDLSEHDLVGTNLSDTVLFRTNLSGMDLRTIPLTNADFRYANLSDSKLLDSLLVNNNFDHTTLKNINFAGKDLSGSSFQQAEFDGSDMQNTNLHSTNFVQVDFTKIKNKSLAGAELYGTSLAHANLAGVDLSGVIMYGTNFWKANLSGQDFTMIVPAGPANTYPLTLAFVESNLSNSNFEGVDLSHKEEYIQVFENKGYLNGYASKIKKELFGEFSQVSLLSAEIRGNDLAVTYVHWSSFAKANLENANFKNADLQYANFYSANLTNADLSGADLRMTHLDGANLQGALLDDAILTGANLKCLNHPICNS